MSPEATARWTALLSPANEKCGSPDPAKGRGSGTAAGVAGLRQRLDRRAAGIGQAEQLCGLVERLAGGVVDGRRQPPVIADAAHFEQLAMAAGDEQQQIGKVEVRIGKPRAERMAFEVIDREQRLARRQRQPLAGKQRHHHAADQARAGRRGDGIDVADRRLGVSQHAPDQIGQDLDVRPRGDLRNHAAVGLMRGILADHRLREDAPIARHQRRRAVVAGGFESKDYGRGFSHFAPGPLPDPRKMH